MLRTIAIWAPAVAMAQGTAPKEGEERRIVVAATTDVHGRIRGWDYYGAVPDSTRGLSRAATIVDSVRQANPQRVVLVDAGDFLQGNPLTFVAARVRSGDLHPVIAAMNAMHYDAATIGNHEFNYGLPFLRRAVAQAEFPMLAANARTLGSAPAFAASRIVVRDGIRIGIVGATTPGAMVWDRDHLRGKMALGDILPAVRREAAAVRTRGADVVVVVLHSGLDEAASYDTVATGLPSENVAARVAREVPGLDLVVFGHSHRELADSLVGSTLLMQPRNWAGSVGLATLTVRREGGRWRVSERKGVLVRAAGHAEQHAVLSVTQRLHDATVSYISGTVATTTARWSSDSSRVRDTPIVDFMLEVMRRRTGADLAATASFALDAAFDSGAVTVAALSRLYPYENTLRAVRITGGQLRQYLEFSARYFKDASKTGVAPGTIDATIPGFNFDVVAGADYTYDLTRPLGQRLTRLTVKGREVRDDDTYTLALNNYRQSGGGGFAMLRGAPVVYDRQEDIRQLLIDEARFRHRMEPREYAVTNWALEPSAAVGVAYAQMHQDARTRETGPAARPSGRTLRIIALNDFHGALEPRRDSAGTMRGGALALASEIARARRECEAPQCVSVVLDGGDEFQGTAASNFLYGKPVVDLFNYLGVAASALGNHEFDWGQDSLRARMRQAHYPILGANVRNADGSDVPWIADDTLLTVGAVRVGVIGLATVETSRTTKPVNVATLRFTDPAPVLDERARGLRARGADVVVVVAHAGAFCSRGDAAVCDGEIITLARQANSRIDAFVSGHTHSPIATVVRGAAVVQARTRGTTLAIADLSLNGGEPQVQLRDVLPEHSGAPDTTVARIVESATAGLRERMAQPITRIAERMSSGADGPLGNLIADAQRHAGQGDVAIMNTGGVRAPLDSGMATFGALFEVQPFGNALVRLTVNGEQLRAYLERVVSHDPVRAHLSGVVVRYDPAKKAGERLVDVRFSDGRPLDPATTYRLVMTDFLAAGGDGLNIADTAIRSEVLPLVDLDALIDYLRAQPGAVRAPREQRLIPVTPP
ncbi:MAG: 5'-nucleotidase C-terminal domain-containing protein [Gemmatimonadaceae bacterium]